MWLLPYKNKADKAAQMKRYRARKKTERELQAKALERHRDDAKLWPKEQRALSLQPKIPEKPVVTVNAKYSMAEALSMARSFDLFSEPVKIKEVKVNDKKVSS